MCNFAFSLTKVEFSCKLRNFSSPVVVVFDGCNAFKINTSTIGLVFLMS